MKIAQLKIAQLRKLAGLMFSAGLLAACGGAANEAASPEPGAHDKMGGCGAKKMAEPKSGGCGAKTTAEPKSGGCGAKAGGLTGEGEGVPGVDSSGGSHPDKSGSCGAMAGGPGDMPDKKPKPKKVAPKKPAPKKRPPIRKPRPSKKAGGGAGSCGAGSCGS